MGNTEALHGRPIQNMVPVDDNTKKAEICEERDCIYAASEVLSKMDENVDPCDDFYRFTCGNYIDKTIIPDDKVSVNTFTVLSDKLQEQLKTIITKKQNESVPLHFQLPNKLYRACMNKSK